MFLLQSESYESYILFDQDFGLLSFFLFKSILGFGF